MLKGIDIASWQAGINAGSIDGDFVIIKATGGTGYVNPYCDSFYQSAKSAGKKLAVYHYAHEIGYQGTAEQEAQFFLDNIQGYIGEAILILDWESDNKSDVGWAKRWLDYVQSKTGIKALFYTYTNVLQSYDFSSIANADYGLWVANYGANQQQGYSFPNPPQSPYWSNTTMFQYTSSGRLPGWNGNLDLNVFYGDATAWDKYAAANGQVTPNPQPIPQDGYSTNGKSLEQMANDVQNGLVGNGDERANVLGRYYVSVQSIVNHRYNNNQAQSVATVNELADQAINGALGNGDERKFLLGTYYNPVQAEVNKR